MPMGPSMSTTRRRVVVPLVLLTALVADVRAFVPGIGGGGRHPTSTQRGDAPVLQPLHAATLTETKDVTVDAAAVTTATDSSTSTQVLKRRNFCVISHPDSGKTTLTEKMLLYGGAIQQAGAVRARASQRKATSDWMELEKQRGISITSTVLSFDYLDFKINLLDTPGHQDFSEDTYRTLAAADNALMLIDGGKGLETQTRKLFEVCRLRGLPIYTFVNKMDRPSKGPIALIDEVEKEMEIECVPMVWPIGDGDEFKGVLDREEGVVHLFQRQARTEKAAELAKLPLDSPELPGLIGETLHQQLMDDVELLDGVMPELDREKVLAGQQTPVFFGSAMSNFGVQLFIDKFLAISGPPSPRQSNLGVINPDHGAFSGFVYKLQANLDPKHRDRIAFVRVCSGKFEKGMKVNHGRLKRQITLSQAQQLFAQERQTVEEAVAGDVIGLNNPGLFAIGDTIYTGNKAIRYPQIPSFSPELFAYIQNKDAGKGYKNFRKGITQLMEEGAVQLLYERNDVGCNQPILAAVGQLQFEVISYRMKDEYGVDTRLEPLGFTAARWSEATWEDVDSADADGKIFGTMQCKDRYGRPVLLFRNEWKINQVADEAPELKLVPWAMAPEEE